MMRVIRREERSDQNFVSPAVRLVLITLSALVFDDVPLIVELLLCQGGEKEPHPIGLKIKRQIHLVGRHNFVVVGAVLCR